MKILSVVVFVIIFIVALIFSILNFHSVQIDFYFFSISLPLTVALTLELFAGIVIGMLVSGMNFLKLKSEYSKLMKKVDRND
ncbi:MAG: hypothetical protein Kow0065_12860 [Methylomicrobium sp.]